MLYGRTAGSKFSPRVLHLKLQANSGLTVKGGSFIGGDAAETAKLNDILGAQGAHVSAKLLGDRAAGRQNVTAAENAVTAAVNDYYKVTFTKDIDIVAVAAQLETLQSVIYAYPEAKPVPAPTAPLYSSLQNYLRPAKNGVNADFAAKYPGGLGGRVRIIDIEYSWNRSHTDLPKAATALVPNGTPNDPFGDNYHGTAVLGEMISANNSYGVTGISPNAALSLVNVNNAEYGYDLPGALQKAASVAHAGDVILIEQQTWGASDMPNSYLPVEWIPEVYDAIHSLTAQGINVIEPAANGSRSLDDVGGTAQAFPMGKPDSGAIIVGAGENCSGTTARLSRSYASNYGVRLDLQGPGDCVVSTGYGDLYSNDGVNNLYTQTFNGTSSASPVVASSAASLSSAYKYLNGGVNLTPAQIRSILKQTGSAQAVGPYAGNIGPMPDLGRALYKADLKGPTTPTLSGSATTTHYASLSWTAATDNVAVANYQIYRNGVLYKTVAGTTFLNTAVTVGTTYSYKVRAVDTAGHASAFSNVVSITVR